MSGSQEYNSIRLDPQLLQFDQVNNTAFEYQQQPHNVPGDDNLDAADFEPLPTHSVPSPHIRSENTASATIFQAGGGTGGSSVCQVCQRTFKRRCDLNRHRKIHTRPFKCPVDVCEYSKRGFPTSQERQRHIDDRHSDKPPVFKCLFPPCKYSSKRESNCKQHMEKTHDWKYDRSRQSHRSNGEAAETAVPVAAAAAAAAASISASASATPAPPQPQGFFAATPLQAPAPSPVGDFILYPEQPTAPMQGLVDGAVVYTNNNNNAISVGGDGASDMVDASVTVANSFVPWESPLTQQDEISRQICSTVNRLESQQSAQESLYPKSIGWFPGAQYSVTPTSAPNLLVPGTYSPHSQNNVAYISSQTPLSAAHTFAPSSTAAWGHPSAVAQRIAQEQFDTLHSPGNDTGFFNAGMGAAGTPAQLPQATPPTVYTSRDVKRDREADSDDADASDEDSRPAKRQRPQPNDADNIDEDGMPCPFRVSDPEYFDRSNEERFSPCHTLHRYISTLFRHLGRAAHSLVITENSASSFGVTEEGRPQPQAGLCRRCWTAFHNKAEFDNHFAARQQCARVSRSKREKYRLIRQTLCAPPPRAQLPAPPSAPSLQPPATIRADTDVPGPFRDPATVSAHLASPSGNGAASPNVKVSPTQSQPKPSALAFGHRANPSVGTATLVGTEGYALVTRHEFQLLNNRVQNLEASMWQIQRQSLARTGIVPPGLGPSQPAYGASNNNHNGNGTATSRAGDDTASQGGVARSVAFEADVSAHERGSLVGGMDRETFVEGDDHDELDAEHEDSNSGGSSGSSGSSSQNRAQIEPGDTDQILRGIVGGTQPRTMSGLSSSSDRSSVCHSVPPHQPPFQPSGHEETGTVRQAMTDSGYASNEVRRAGQQSRSEGSGADRAASAGLTTVYEDAAAAVAAPPAGRQNVGVHRGRQTFAASELDGPAADVDALNDGELPPSVFPDEPQEEPDGNWV